MPRRDHADILAGLFLVVLGLGAGLWSLMFYDIGTIRMMGPGMVPTVLGFFIAGLGALVTGGGFIRAGTMPRMPWRTLFFISLGVIAFAMTARPFGIGPAVFLSVFLSSRADREASTLHTLLLAIVLAVAGFALFRYALGVPMQFIQVPL